MSTKALSGVAILSAGLMLAGAAVGAQDTAQPGPPARKLELKFNNGLVTLRAQNVTVREVLTEWARLCDCQVIGAEKITSAPLAGAGVQYVNQPEAVIMKSLLNPGSQAGAVSGGYVFVPRGPGETGASAYASIRIAPVSHPTAVSYSQQPSSPVAAPLINDGNDELPPVVNIPLQDPAKTQQAPAPPVAPVVPPSVMPTTGVNPGVGRTGGPGLPTAPPTVPPTGTGRGGGGF
jgi:hypothetical protein